MDIEMVLGRIGGGSQKYGDVFAASTSPDRVTATELAGVFAGMRHGPYLLALAKFLGDSTKEKEFYEYVHEDVLDLMAQRSWREPKGSCLFSQFVIMALWEIYGNKGGEKCNTCSGMGYVPGDGEDGLAEATGRPLPKLCPKCNGKGKINPTQRAKARLLEISEAQWSRVWRKRYEEVKSQVERILESYRLDMESHIIAKMRSGVSRSGRGKICCNPKGCAGHRV